MRRRPGMTPASHHVLTVVPPFGPASVVVCTKVRFRYQLLAYRSCIAVRTSTPLRMVGSAGPIAPCGCDWVTAAGGAHDVVRHTASDKTPSVIVRNAGRWGEWIMCVR